MEFSVVLCKPGAVPPRRSHPTDTGFDLVLLDVVKDAPGGVTFYGTGVCVTPPTGFYFDLVPRSSISKTGYALANSIGIIDMDYTGEVIVPLRKVDEAAPDLELPCRLVQLVPRQWHDMRPVIVDRLDTTPRGAGSFGSTSEK